MDISFSTLYSGNFKGLFKKELFDSFMSSVDEEQTWYEIVITSHDYEFHEIGRNDVKKHIEMYINKIEEKGHHTRYDWFYTDTIESPRMVKIYDPLLCGCSGGDSVPWAILTISKPSDEDLKEFNKSPEKQGLKDQILCKIRDIKSLLGGSSE